MNLMLHPLDWKALNGLLTDLIEGRAKLSRDGETAALGSDEEYAIWRFKHQYDAKRDPQP